MRHEIMHTFCSLNSAYSGMNAASVSLIPRSCRNFSNSSCTVTSSVSNYIMQNIHVNTM